MTQVLTMVGSGALGARLDAYTTHTLGFLLLSTALPFLGPSPSFHLPPTFGLLVSSLVALYVSVGLIGPTQSVLCLKVLRVQAGLTQHDVAGALAAANVATSMLGALAGPLVAGGLVPDLVAFEDATSWLGWLVALCYLPPLLYLRVFSSRHNNRRDCCLGCGCCCCRTVPECCCSRVGHQKPKTAALGVADAAEEELSPWQRIFAKKGS